MSLPETCRSSEVAEKALQPKDVEKRGITFIEKLASLARYTHVQHIISVNKPTCHLLLLPILIILLLLPTSQQLQMTRLSRKTALRLGNQAGSEFLERQEPSVSSSSPWEENRTLPRGHMRGDEDANVRTLVILACRIKDCFLGAICRGPRFIFEAAAEALVARSALVAGFLLGSVCEMSYRLAVAGVGLLFLS